jgi:hypothetical protein
MTRTLRASTWWTFFFLACSPPMATLEVTAGSLRVDGQVAVSVSASDGTQPGSGGVTLTTSLGALDATALTLADGAARTVLRCPRATPGCVAGASITLTARWNRTGGVVTGTATVRVTDPMVVDSGPVDAGSMDAGRQDAGLDDAGLQDAGSADASVPDAGRGDAGVEFSAATPLDLDAGGLVIGPFSTTRTVGFSLFGDNATVRLGFDGPPESPVLVSGRLLYLRRGGLFGWVDDAPDGSVPTGPDGGRFPLFAPERNHVRVSSGCDTILSGADAGLAVRLTRTSRDEVWVQCQLQFDGGIRYFKQLGQPLFLVRSGGSMLASSTLGVLASAPDGGLSFESDALLVSPTNVPVREYAWPAARPVSDTTFEALAFDPVASRCRVARISLAANFGSLTVSERPVPPTLPGSRACLQWRFLGAQDVLVGVDSTLGVRAVSFGLEPDGGVVDAGTADAGAADGGELILLEPGPPSDLTAEPPVLSIDFQNPAVLQVVTP